MKNNLVFNDEYLEEMMLTGALNNKTFFLKINKYLTTSGNKSYFIDPKNQTIFNLISRWHSKFGIIPSEKEVSHLIEKMQKDDEIKVLLKGLYRKYTEADVTSLNFDFLILEAKNFIIQNRLYEAISQTPKLIEENNFGQVVEMARTAINVNFDNNLGLSIRDIDRIKEKLEYINSGVCTPTGINSLDNYLDGGVRPGELFVISAVPGGFKTGTLGCIGLHNFMLGKKVIIYSMETGEERLMSRYIQNLANLTKMEIVTNEYQDKLKEKLDMFSGELLVKQYPANEVCANDLVSHITEVETHLGWTPDILLIDYLLIMKTNDQRLDPGQSYKYYKTVSEEVRNIGISYKIPVFSAIQINREGMGDDGGSKKITTSKNIAESAGVFHTADYFMTLNQTADQKAKNEMMQFLEKNRNGEAHKKIMINVDYEHMRISEIRGVEKK